MIPHSTLPSAIDRLEEKNLIHRVISHKDRRSFEHKLTNEGLLIREENKRVEMLIGTMVLEDLDTEKEISSLINFPEKIR